MFCELSVLPSNPSQTRFISVYSPSLAWEKAVQELGKMSAKIAWHSPRTLRYASNHLQREKYYKVTSYKTAELSYNYAILRYL